jgi:hypothetical protein
VDDNTGELIPRYFRLWNWINCQLPASERQTARRRAKPESILREAQDALATLASEWNRTFEAFQEASSPVPPVPIVVCDNTNPADETMRRKLIARVSWAKRWWLCTGTSVVFADRGSGEAFWK